VNKGRVYVCEQR